MNRVFLITPAFDKRDPNPSKNYGIHGATMCFYVKGAEGTVQFIVYTNWMLPHVREEIPPRADHRLCRPMAADLGYHSPVPMYEEQPMLQGSCEYLDGRPCFYDGSTLNAEPFLECLIAEGSEAVWAKLEDYYRSTFL